MSEWDRIQRHLADSIENMFEEIVLPHNDQMNADADGAWSSFISECRTRYLAGRAQHAGSGTTWDEWSDEDFEKNIREELIDYVIYSAARTARRRTH